MFRYNERFNTVLIELATPWIKKAGGQNVAIFRQTAANF